MIREPLFWATIIFLEWSNSDLDFQSVFFQNVFFEVYPAYAYSIALQVNFFLFVFIFLKPFSLLEWVYK